MPKTKQTKRNANAGRNRGSFRPLRLFLLLLLCLSLSACRADGRSLRVYNQKNSDISDASLVRSLVLAMNDPGQVPVIFQQLPAAAQDALSEEDFRRYVTVLKPSGGEQIRSFSELGLQESADFAQIVAGNAPEYANLALHSGYFRLSYRPQAEVKYRDHEESDVIVAVQRDDEGLPYISRLWSTAVVRMHDFATLYFDTLEQDALGKGDLSALAYLIENGKPAFSSGDWAAFSLYKAGKIRDYYDEYVLVNPRDSICQYLLPGVCAYAQDYRYSSRLSGTREVHFTESKGVFTVQEEMPQALSRDLSSILISGQPLFPERYDRKKSQYSEKDLHPLAGPLLTVERLDNNFGRSHYLLHYYGMDIGLLGLAYENSGKWHGKIESITFRSGIFSLGKSLRVGMAESDWYQQLPFYSPSNNMYSMSSSIFDAMRLSYEVSGGQLSALRLERSDTDDETR